MNKPENQREILEFIFDCSSRDKLMKKYLQLETWTPAQGAMIVCGIRPLLGQPTEIPDAAVGIDGVDLERSSKRIRNAVALLRNWSEESEEYGQSSPFETTPSEFINWCIDSGYITDWLRLIASFSAYDIEPGMSIAHGGISDSERITIFPAVLMSGLVETANTQEVLHQAINRETIPAHQSGNTSPGLVGTPTQKLEVLRCKKKNPTPLDCAIDLAKESATDPWNYQSVWLALVELAQQKDRPYVLMGFVEGEGIKVRNDTDKSVYKAFTKNALKGRMNRNAMNST